MAAAANRRRHRRLVVSAQFDCKSLRGHIESIADKYLDMGREPPEAVQQLYAAVAAIEQLLDVYFHSI